MRRWLLALWFVFCPLLGQAAGEIPLPALHARVTDLVNALSKEQAAALEAKLAAFEGQKGVQVAVLILPTTEPETIEAFATRLFEAWKLGRKGVDDGVLLIVAKNDRRMRIEVGYGLEGALNDATAKRIIAEIITPRFQAGDYPGGIEAGADAILKVVNNEPLPPPPGVTGKPSGDGGVESVLFFFALGLAILGGVLRDRLGNLKGAGVVGALAAVGGGFWAGVGGIIVGGIAGFLIALFGLDLMLALTSGSGGGSYGGGSSGGGGGWSGGGGSSGGGGASGSW